MHSPGNSNPTRELRLPDVNMLTLRSRKIARDTAFPNPKHSHSSDMTDEILMELSEPSSLVSLDPALGAEADEELLVDSQASSEGEAEQQNVMDQGVDDTDPLKDYWLTTHRPHLLPEDTLTLKEIALHLRALHPEEQDNLPLCGKLIYSNEKAALFQNNHDPISLFVVNLTANRKTPPIVYHDGTQLTGVDIPSLKYLSQVSAQLERVQRKQALQGHNQEDVTTFLAANCPEIAPLVATGEFKAEYANKATLVTRATLAPLFGSVKPPMGFPCLIQNDPRRWSHQQVRSYSPGTRPFQVHNQSAPNDPIIKVLHKTLLWGHFCITDCVNGKWRTSFTPVETPAQGKLWPVQGEQPLPPLPSNWKRGNEDCYTVLLGGTEEKHEAFDLCVPLTSLSGEWGGKHSDNTLYFIHPTLLTQSPAYTAELIKKLIFEDYKPKVLVPILGNISWGHWNAFSFSPSILTEDKDILFHTQRLFAPADNTTWHSQKDVHGGGTGATYALLLLQNTDDNQCEEVKYNNFTLVKSDLPIDNLDPYRIPSQGFAEILVVQTTKSLNIKGTRRGTLFPKFQTRPTLNNCNLFNNSFFLCTKVSPNPGVRERLSTDKHYLVNSIHQLQSPLTQTEWRASTAFSVVFEQEDRSDRDYGSSHHKALLLVMGEKSGANWSAVTNKHFVVFNFPLGKFVQRLDFQPPPATDRVAYVLYNYGILYWPNPPRTEGQSAMHYFRLNAEKWKLIRPDLVYRAFISAAGAGVRLTVNDYLHNGQHEYVLAVSKATIYPPAQVGEETPFPWIKIKKPGMKILTSTPLKSWFHPKSSQSQRPLPKPRSPL